MSAFGRKGVSRAWWLGLALWPAFGGCDLFSFPSPVRQQIQDAGAGAGGAPDEQAHPKLGDPCVATGKPGTSCGVDEHGAAMTCFRASALAGEDFCAPACSPSDDAVPEQVCTAEGARLPVCHPHLPAPEADCPPGLNCYRTSLFDDRGVCIKMPVCTTNSDCPDSVHATCSAEVVRSMLGAAAALLPLDHLNCAKTNCVALSTACPTDEGCLGTMYDATIADICTPYCDASLHCPPNFSCAQATSGPGAAKLCLPGMPGLRCDGPHCVGGSCDDTGAGFKVCSRECETTEDCRLLNTESDAFFCVDGASGRHCVTPRPFHGANCTRDEQCRQDLGEFCSQWSIQGLHALPGECRQPCKADGTCDPRGGLAHTCAWGPDGGCFPGEQGLPCTLSSECVEGLACEDVSAELDVDGPAARICTRACGGEKMTQADADAQCSPTHQINGGAYCAAGYCRPKREGDQACSRGAQCSSGMCNMAKRTCVANRAAGLPG